MSIISPSWYEKLSPSEKEAVRSEFSNKPVNEFDLSLGLASALEAISNLTDAVISMDGHNKKSIDAIFKTFRSISILQSVIHSTSHDDFVKKYWPHLNEKFPESNEDLDNE